MEPFFDQRGRVVAWLRGDFLYATGAMEPIAFVRQDNVFRMRQTQYLGFIRTGVIRDRQAGAVAFRRGATIGVQPVVPVIPVTPVTPVTPVRPVTPVLPVSPITPIGTWGRLSWEGFLSQ